MLPHVLIVDDNAMNCHLLTRLLERWQVRADFVLSGIEAIEKVNNSRYDLIFMDLQMPLMSGFEVATQIRRSDSLSCHAPIIAMTASVKLKEMESIYTCGMNDYIAKPFSSDDIYKALLRHIAPKMALPVAVVSTQQAIQNQAGSAITDLSYLNELAAGNITFIRRMITVFCEQSPELINQMLMAAHEKNWPFLRTVAHKMKPTLKMMGIQEGEMILKKIEIFGYGANTDINQLYSKLKKLQNLCELAYIELKNNH